MNTKVIIYVKVGLFKFIVEAPLPVFSLSLIEAKRLLFVVSVHRVCRLPSGVDVCNGTGGDGMSGGGGMNGDCFLFGVGFLLLGEGACLLGAGRSSSDSGSDESDRYFLFGL